MAFCSSCGEELIDGDLFCRSCGAPIGKTEQMPENQRSTSACDYETEEECLSEVLMRVKCPACGEPLEPDTEFCPACDYPIASSSASEAVNEFMQDLARVEAEASAGEASYSRVVREIDAFAIPRTANGVLAFLIVAKGRLTTSVRDYGQGAAAKDAVSQAWISKAQYAYDVANLLFPKAVEIGDIEAAYKVIRSIAGRNSIIKGAGSAAKVVKNGGCLTKIVTFYLAIIALGLVLSLMGTILRYGWISWVLLGLAIALVLYYLKNKADK